MFWSPHLQRVLAGIRRWLVKKPSDSPFISRGRDSHSQATMDIQLLLVPYDTARHGWRSGAGPEHLLQAGLTTHLQARGHSVANLQVIEPDPDQPPAEMGTAFDLMRRLAVAVRAVRAAGQFPVVLSGNCNAAVGTLSGLTPARRAIFLVRCPRGLQYP
ncbi:MAG: arginase family protein [Vicinamibacterales bacterium]